MSLMVSYLLLFAGSVSAQSGASGLRGGGLPGEPRLSEERMVFQVRLRPLVTPLVTPVPNKPTPCTSRLCPWVRGCGWVWVDGCQWAQTSYGDVEFAFYPDIAPVTVQHILQLARLGAYNSNHFFRVCVAELTTFVSLH